MTPRKLCGFFYKTSVADINPITLLTIVRRNISVLSQQVHSYLLVTPSVASILFLTMQYSSQFYHCTCIKYKQSASVRGGKFKNCTNELISTQEAAQQFAEHLKHQILHQNYFFWFDFLDKMHEKVSSSNPFTASNFVFLIQFPPITSLSRRQSWQNLSF